MHHLKLLKRSLHTTIKGTLITCLLCTFIHIPNVTGQSNGTECSQSKIITIPFIKDTGVIKRAKVHVIDQANPYEQTDQFSYWYKLNVEADVTINCQVTPINKNDKYVVYIYKYKGNDFCEKLVKGKIKHVRVENEENEKSILEASEATDFEFEAFKNDKFYFSILTISKNNCGHKFQLITGTDTLNVTSTHAPCIGAPAEKEKTIAIAPKAEIKQTADTVSVSGRTKKTDTVTVVVKEKNKALKITTAKITVSDVSGKPAKVITTNKTTKLIFERGKKYTVECSATGYKNFNHPMVINEYVTPDSNQLIIFMKPLKAGDNFVMNNIYFFPNTYALKDGSKEALTGLVNYLTNNPKVKIELQGHTNGNSKCTNKAKKDQGPQWEFSGSAKKLSLMRAEEIKRYLVEHGAKKEQITTVGFGGEKMIVANPKSPEAIKKNARVEVVILDDGGN
jgi:outer membrane protein OmpA-like peptidoglycan-associated protein